LQDDALDFTTGQGVFKAITEQDHHGKALTQFVGSTAGAGGLEEKEKRII
jgi:hypothetical protein